MFGNHILSEDPWMGQPPKKVEYGQINKFMLVCNNGHEEVTWRAEKAVGDCWVCGKSQGSLFTI